ncbi:MAG: phenylalanine--tRNA ligase subunit beta [Alphaproteobacteria bacterium]|nr:phenylalanine--tRNA ligase subunit beta [Alphaproteobacteria bacterium]
MKFTINRLKKHLDTNASDEEICDKLTNIGLEMEEFEDKSSVYEPFKVAYVEKAEKHPDADKLKVCMVKTENELLQVVCGAPNARAGMKGVFAPTGSYVPGLDMKLKKSKIRGVESNGMLVSEREMCLSDEHGGIIEVDDSYEIGTPMAEIFGLDEKVVEIGLTPNRADCAGVRGIARDLAAAGIGKLKEIDDSAVKGTFPCPISVTIEDKDGCNMFCGRLFKNVKNGSSPMWLQNMLKNVGLRPISALVDITNLMTMEYGRPLHVYDADKLQGDIVVRKTREGEKIDALNDKSYETIEGAVGITDDNGLIGLGGIVGGVGTCCEEDAVNIFVEAAYFDAIRIARAGRDMNIPSDARYRFERGVDPEFTRPGMEIATRLILELCGTDETEVSEIVQAGDVPEWKREIEFDPAYTQKLCGVDVPADEQIAILERLGFGVKNASGNMLKVSPPSWRGDIEGKADLTEEVSRIYGFENIEPISVRSEKAVTSSAETLELSRARMARSAMAMAGLSECVTWSFMNKTLASAFGSNDNETLSLCNPISSELDQMRPSILPNLIEAAGRNSDRGFYDVALCEVGPVFRSVKPDGQACMAAGIRAGNKTPRHWVPDANERAADAYDAKADALSVLEACGAPAASVQISTDAPDYYHPGRSGVLRLGKNIIAQFGEIHPAILDEMGIKTSVAGFEIFLDNIPQPRKKGTSRPLLALSPFQPLTRDFAFVVKDAVSAEDLVRAAKSGDKKLISDACVFDVYKGKNIEDGHKSVALSVTIEPKDATLSDEQLEALMNNVIDSVANRCGGVLRG